MTSNGMQTGVSYDVQDDELVSLLGQKTFVSELR